MEILVTNDDGIRAPGIRVLAEAAKEFGAVTVIAPDRNWSACGHQKSLGRPMRADPVSIFGDIEAYAIDGGPSDCTALAGLGFLNKKIDLVLSGINPGANVSQDVTYSGTVNAALEATIWQMRGMAFSLDVGGVRPESVDFSVARDVIRRTIDTFITNELPPYTALNVNIPYLPVDEMQGFKVTHCGERIYRDVLDVRNDPFGRPYYWFGGLPPTGDTETGTDCGELSRGFVSITPVHLDLTAYNALSTVKKWDW